MLGDFIDKPIPLQVESSTASQEQYNIILM